MIGIGIAISFLFGFAAALACVKWLTLHFPTPPGRPAPFDRLDR